MDNTALTFMILLSGMLLLAVFGVAARAVAKHGLLKRGRDSDQSRQLTGLLIGVVLVAAGILFYVVLPIVISIMINR